MSNQQPPYNPFMFPYPYPYPPPPYMNPMMPMMPMPPRNNQLPMGPDPFPHHPLSMPPFGYPPYRMMYPPTADPFYPFPDIKPQSKASQSTNPPPTSKDSNQTKPDNAKKSSVSEKVPEKKESMIIVLSDDDEKQNNIKSNHQYQKKAVQTAKNKDVILSEARPRRTQRKIVPTPIVQLAPPKTRPIEKKRESKIVKEDKKVAEQEKSTKFVPQPTQEFVYERKRMRILTAKDGKGKIMVGDEFQASVPTFSSKDERFTIWVVDVKNQLLSRSFK